MSQTTSGSPFPAVFASRNRETTASTLPSGSACVFPAASSTQIATLLHRWRHEDPRYTLVVTDTPRTLETLYQDYHTLSGGDMSAAAYFPGWEELPDADLRGVSPEIAGDRLSTLVRLQARARPLCVFTDVQGLLQPVPAPDQLAERTLALRPGDEWEPDALCERLRELGYVFEAEVTDKGEAARRGGVLDLWPPQQADPVRMDFFGDEIDSLRVFRVADQRSVSSLDLLEVLPARETGGGREARLTDYLPGDTRWLWFDYPSIADHAVLYQESRAHADITWAEVRAEAERRCGGGMLLVGDGLSGDPLPLALEPLAGVTPSPEGEVSDRVEQERRGLIRRQVALARSGWTVVFCLNTAGSVARFREAYGDEFRDQAGVFVREGMIAEGVHFPEIELSVVGERDIYGFRKPVRNKYDRHARTRGGHGAEGPRLQGWSDIEPGEWVVHLDHGIGKYLGLYEIDMAGAKQEVLSIEYAGGAKLHVPVSQAHLLTRYMGVGGGTPEPHALGGGAWNRQKTTAEKAVRDLAGHLLRTQALREARSGHAFAADTPWQAEFEATFPFAETADQEAAIRAAKQDMESEKPMDRLICGDVGYGKTEVAMRAAFKAVMDGKQVAMLVPTTVLALQHTQNFRERMAAFPVAIDMLSRLRTPAEQRETLRRLKNGEVDIVIGTHRLVSRDVAFHDLGLVIIDEEQRFGVRHKERLKEMKGLVDILTLSATPIPRTLYLGLVGARDVSTIQTAPRERLPVKTEVHLFDEEVVRNAILRELNRGGQVFFLHNRVQTLELIRRRLVDLVPEARLGVGHGQMPERRLERVLEEFSRGDSDVLLCTTIIESGVDMPNVNTMIIDRADRFGLAELYQLRGRVGRYKHQAHCLLLLPPKGGSRAVSRDRLRMIRKYSALGSGFKIALRDLEIRGAGNLLGPQQSGHIASVGFELYCQLLEQSVRRLKKLPPERVVDVKARIDFLDHRPEAAGEDACCLPVDYIEDEALRVRMYRRVAALATPEAIDGLAEDLADRFGRPPTAVDNLLALARVRVAASERNLREVEVRDRKVHLHTHQGTLVQPNHRFPVLRAETAPDRMRELLTLVLGQDVVAG